MKKLRPHSHAVARFSVSRAALLYVIVASVLLFDALAGPIRLYSSSIGLEAIIYLPKMLALCAVFLAFAFSSQPRIAWVVIAIIGVSALVAIINDNSFAAMAFAVFIISPLLLGLIVPVPTTNGRPFLWVAVSLWLITVIGVWLDIFLDFPWQGTGLELFGTSIESSRSWSTMGIERPAGFARLSAAAAIYVGITGIILWSLVNRSWLRTLILLTTLATVVITTNKAAVAGMILVLIFGGLQRSSWIRRAMLAGLVTATIGLPLSTSTNEYAFDLRDDLDVALIASFEDRLVNTWPNFIDAISVPTIGEGLGGVGTPVKQFNTDSTKFALSFSDNTALYLIGWLGVTGCFAFGWVALKAYRLASDVNGWRNALGLVGVFILACSLTTDMIEGTIASFMLGMLIRAGSQVQGQAVSRTSVPVVAA